MHQLQYCTLLGNRASSCHYLLLKRLLHTHDENVAIIRIMVTLGISCADRTSSIKVDQTPNRTAALHYYYSKKSDRQNMEHKTVQVTGQICSKTHFFFGLLLL